MLPTNTIIWASLLGWHSSPPLSKLSICLVHPLGEYFLSNRLLILNFGIFHEAGMKRSFLTYFNGIDPMPLPQNFKIGKLKVEPIKSQLAFSNVAFDIPPPTHTKIGCLHISLIGNCGKHMYKCWNSSCAHFLKGLVQSCARVGLYLLTRATVEMIGMLWAGCET